MHMARWMGRINGNERPPRVTGIERLVRLTGAGVVLAAGCAAFGQAGFREELAGTTATLEMVPIPAGAFRSGETTIEIPAMWMSKTEITWDLFDVFVYRLDATDNGTPAGVDAVTRPSKPYLPPDRGFGHEGFPAISMSHKGAAEFCVWLSAKTGRTYRLPTEAEWEYAARAGAAEPVSLDEIAWYSGNAKDTTHRVGGKAANAWGLHDMLGNAAEWCDGADGKPVTRGGSYRDGKAVVAFGARVPQDSSWNMSDPQVPKSGWWLADCSFVGFRVVCEGPPPAREGK